MRNEALWNVSPNCDVKGGRIKNERVPVTYLELEPWKILHFDTLKIEEYSYLMEGYMKEFCCYAPILNKTNVTLLDANKETTAFLRVISFLHICERSARVGSCRLYDCTTCPCLSLKRTSQ